MYQQGTVTAPATATAFILTVQPGLSPRREARPAGRKEQAQPGGDLRIVSLERESTRAAFQRSPDSIHFLVSPSGDGGSRQPTPLESGQVQGCVVDPLVNVLGALLVACPELPSPQRASFIYDQVVAALRIHVTSRYGRDEVPAPRCRGGLAPWQLRRATGLMEADLTSPSLVHVAKACKLSLSHFSRAFRQTTGQPPRRWLLERRIGHAKSLLQDSALPLTEVALQCGFNDQAHFSRMFSKVAGTSPGRWRRQFA